MPEPKKDGAMARYFRGASYFGRGFGFLVEHQLWPWLIAPTLLTALLTVFGAWATWHWGNAWVDARVAGSWVVWATIVRILLWFVVLGATLVSFLVAGLIATAPFAGPLSARVEAKRTGVAPPPTTLRDTLDDVVHTIVSLCIYLTLAGFVFLCQIVMSPLAPFLGVLGFCITAKYLAFDNLDFPLSRRKKTFDEKWKWLNAHKAETNGFGSLVALLTFLPGFGLVVPAIAAAGATLLYLDLEQPPSP